MKNFPYHNGFCQIDQTLQLHELATTQMRLHHIYPVGNNHISHLGKMTFIFQTGLVGNMLVPRRVVESAGLQLWMILTKSLEAPLGYHP